MVHHEVQILVSQPCWLYASVITALDKRLLITYRSPQFRKSSPIFAPIRKVLHQSTKTTLLFREMVDDTRMMLGKAEIEVSEVVGV